MTAQSRRVDEIVLLDLLSGGGFAVTGASAGDRERMMPGDSEAGGECCDDGNDWYGGGDGGDDFEDDWFDDDDAEDDRELRPDWLHPDCRDVCTALDLGTCCGYPDNPLVRAAVDLADAVERTVSRPGRDGCGGGDGGGADAGLSRQLRLIPGLLAQIHAVMPRLNKTAVAQLLCPVGRLGSALGQASGTPRRRQEAESVRAMLDECSDALRAALGWPARSRPA